VSLGAGEIVLNSIDADGTKTGFDLVITRRISESVGVPVVASGGAGSWSTWPRCCSKAKPTPSSPRAFSISAPTPWNYERPDSIPLAAHRAADLLERFHDVRVVWAI
jgi:hypothetical protein